MNNTELVDICGIKIDKNLSPNERKNEYLRQIKDPYHFKCGKFIITAKFTEGGPTLEDCLSRLII
jgi:hypothetical protein